jgi:hypothetical protein
VDAENAPPASDSAPLSEAAEGFEAAAASLAEQQGEWRSVAETGLAESRAAYARAEAAAEEIADAVESSLAAAASRGAALGLRWSAASNASLCAGLATAGL